MTIPFERIERGADAPVEGENVPVDAPVKEGNVPVGFSCAVERHRIHEELTGQELKDS